MRIANRSILLAFILCAFAAPILAADAPPDPAIAARLLALVNQVRGNAGLAAVQLNPALGAVAQSLANDLARRGALSHQDSAGAGIDARFLQGGYRYSIAAELVAGAHATPEEVMADWMANPSNRDELLMADLEDAGVGYVLAPSSDPLKPASGYWVLDMAAPIVRNY